MRGTDWRHPEASHHQRPRVLVVDDEQSVRTFADRVLREAGYEVVVASDGREALRIVEHEPPFDLFIIDLVMPAMQGEDLARTLRLRDPDVKVLYFTGFSDRLFEEKRVLGGNEAFIEKPASVEGFLESVSLMLFGHL